MSGRRKDGWRADVTKWMQEVPPEYRATLQDHFERAVFNWAAELPEEYFEALLALCEKHRGAKRSRRPRLTVIEGGRHFDNGGDQPAA